MPVCKIDEITVKDADGLIRQCISCRTCPVGEGSLVQCNKVITRHTPDGCEKCQAGKTFSAKDGKGICEPCADCEARGRVTEKLCTPESNSRCGGCKPGRYEDRLTGQCELCSPCCGDDHPREQECEDQDLSAAKVRSL